MELAAWFFFFRLACDVSEGVDGQVLVEVRPKIDHACGKKYLLDFMAHKTLCTINYMKIVGADSEI